MDGKNRALALEFAAGSIRSDVQTQGMGIFQTNHQ
jgi:hypothetical protein